MTPEMVKSLLHSRYIFAPPVTRLNEAGYYEDVPEEAQGDAAPATDAAPPADIAVPEAAGAPALGAESPDVTIPGTVAGPQPEPAPQAELPLEPPAPRAP
jgi:hypothetical protein